MSVLSNPSHTIHPVVPHPQLHTHNPRLCSHPSTIPQRDNFIQPNFIRRIIIVYLVYAFDSLFYLFNILIYCLLTVFLVGTYFSFPAILFCCLRLSSFRC